jgi:hypothetical protein
MNSGIHRSGWRASGAGFTGERDVPARCFLQKAQAITWTRVNASCFRTCFPARLSCDRVGLRYSIRGWNTPGGRRSCFFRIHGLSSPQRPLRVQLRLCLQLLPGLHTRLTLPQTAPCCQGRSTMQPGPRVLLRPPAESNFTPRRQARKATCRVLPFATIPP